MDLLEKWQKEAGMEQCVRMAFEASEGISAQNLAQAAQLAAMGHSFSVPASSLPAYLDQAQMEAAARIMRRNPDAES
ncbi:MAG: hypothetical protein LBM64_03495, partial [Deltaproteobacteria bacterium]|nr:hypothetical protein [Deltaproteobacteria bacterium]